MTGNGESGVEDPPRIAEDDVNVLMRGWNDLNFDSMFGNRLRPSYVSNFGPSSLGVHSFLISIPKSFNSEGHYGMPPCFAYVYLYQYCRHF